MYVHSFAIPSSWTSLRTWNQKYGSVLRIHSCERKTGVEPFFVYLFKKNYLDSKFNCCSTDSGSILDQDWWFQWHVKRSLRLVQLLDKHVNLNCESWLSYSRDACYIKEIEIFPRWHEARNWYVSSSLTLHVKLFPGFTSTTSENRDCKNLKRSTNHMIKKCREIKTQVSVELQSDLSVPLTKNEANFLFVFRSSERFPFHRFINYCREFWNRVTLMWIIQTHCGSAC